MALLGGANGAAGRHFLALRRRCSIRRPGRVLVRRDDILVGRRASHHRVLGHDLHLPELSAAENLAFFARAWPCRRRDRAVKARARERAGLDHATIRRDGSRGGCASAFARARAVAPASTGLLDEPFTGLDDAATTAAARLTDLRGDGCIVLVATTIWKPSTASLIARCSCVAAGLCRSTRARLAARSLSTGPS